MVPIQPENAVIPYVKGFPKYEANLFINDDIPVKYENDQQKTNQCGSLSRGIQSCDFWPILHYALETEQDTGIVTVEH